jgi:hypothetical protein
MNTQSKAAYLAGFMDGEGSFSIVKTYQIKRHVDGTKVKNIRYHMHIKISNTNEAVLKWIVKHFGGQISSKKLIKHWKPRWDLTITGNKNMEKYILSILPYLIIKREQALVALSFVRLHGKEVPEERAKLRDKMLALNNSSQPHSKSQTTNTLNSPENGQKIESELNSNVKRESAVKSATTA